MKKNYYRIMYKVCIVIICMLCFFFVACDPGYRSYNEETLISDVARVELISYEQPKAKVINTFFGAYNYRFLSFNLKKMTVIESLDDEYIEDFFRDLSEVSIWTHWIHLNSPDGICIRLVYNNEDFDVLSVKDIDGEKYSIIMKYNKRGRVLDYIGPFSNTDDFQLLIENFSESL